MIAAALIAASVLAPAGVTAGIQADPVCLPVTAQPGHSYPLTVYVQGTGPLTLTVTPITTGLAARLHQVPASWVSFGQNPATGTVSFTLAVVPDAEPGAYESDIKASASPSAASGGGAQATLGAAATTAIVLTVGPSNVPPPPCDALDLAQSTGQFPPWPTKAFKTSSWAQVFAREKAAPDPHASPTVTSRSAAASHPAAPAVQYAPASPAASQGSAKTGADLIGWAAIGLAVLYVISRLRGGRKGGKP